MINFFKTTLALPLVFLIAACGGGTQQESQDKYAGTYSYCDNDHTRYRATLTGTGKNNYSMSYSEIIYQNADCTGSVLATYSEPDASTWTFIETATAPVSAPGLASSLSIDKYKLNIPQQTARLTGTNLTLRGDGLTCFPVTTNRVPFCYRLDVEEESVDIGVYLGSTGYSLLILENGTYENKEGSVFVKE